MSPKTLPPKHTLTDDPAADAIPRWRRVLAHSAKWLSIAGCLFTAVGWLAIPNMFFGAVLIFLFAGMVVGFLSICAGIAALWKGRSVLDKPTRRRAIGGIIRGGIVLLLSLGGIVFAGLAFVYIE